LMLDRNRAASAETASYAVVSRPTRHKSVDNGFNLYGD
jgi:hypothetical protein